MDMLRVMRAAVGASEQDELEHQSFVQSLVKENEGLKEMLFASSGQPL
jgi:hypothetical protein